MTKKQYAVMVEQWTELTFIAVIFAGVVRVERLQFAVVVADKWHIAKRHAIVADVTDVTKIVLRLTNHARLQLTTRTQRQPCRL